MQGICFGEREKMRQKKKDVIVWWSWNAFLFFDICFETRFENRTSLKIMKRTTVFTVYTRLLLPFDSIFVFAISFFPRCTRNYGVFFKQNTRVPYDEIRGLEERDTDFLPIGHRQYRLPISFFSRSNRTTRILLNAAAIERVAEERRKLADVQRNRRLS